MLALILFYLAVTKSVTGDETSTAWLASQLSFFDLIHHNYNGEFNPPGFFIINKIFISLFGYHSVVLKSVPLVFYFASIFMLYKVFKALGLRHESLFLPLIIYSLMPLNIYYSVFDKPYSFLLFITNSILFLIIKIRSQPSMQAYFLYFITVSIGLYIHFFTGLIVFLLFLIGLPFFWKEKNFIKRIFVLNIMCFLVFVPELNFLVSSLGSISEISQSHSSQGFFLKLLFILWGLFFGNTLTPISAIINCLVVIFFTLFLYSYIKNFKALKGKQELWFIFFFCAISIIFISATDIARPMYVIFLTPFLSLMLFKVFEYENNKLLGSLLISLFLISNFNFASQNSKFYVSPQDTINYKQHFNFNGYISHNDLVIISPSYNESTFKLYNQSHENVIYINPYKAEITDQLQTIGNQFQNIYLFEEHQINNISNQLDQFFKDRRKTVLKDFTHSSFLNQEEYSYFKIIKYELEQQK